MWLPSAAILSDPHLNRDALFVSQVWRELLDARSPDTYRARVLDPFLLIEELQKVCELAKNDTKWMSHVHSICAEIADWKLTTDRLDLPAAAKHAIGVISSSTNLKYEDLHRVAESALLVRQLVGEPLYVLLADARSLLDNGFKRKIEFVQTLAFIASHASRLGVRDSILIELDECSLVCPPEDILDLIAAHLSPEWRDFSCFLSVTAPIRDMDSLLAGSGFVRIGLPRIEHSVQGVSWHASHDGGYLTEVQVKARSSRLAAEGALSNLQAMLSMLSLYANQSLYRIADQVLVEDAGTYVVEDVSPAKHYGLFARKDHIRTARERMRHAGWPVDGRIRNVLGAHALGISASDPRAALSHFWTSLEAIAGSLGSGGIGERVAGTIAPIVTSRRVHKIVTYLALSIYETRKIIGTKLDKGLMPASTDGYVSRADVLCCVSGPEDNVGVLDLFKVVSANPLLCFHLYSFWLEMHDPKLVARAMRRSEQRVKWQILRIYRARNVFVHKGGGDELAWRLLENAQSYISFVLGRLMFDLGSNTGWSVDTALEFERQHFERLCDCAQRLGADAGLKGSDFLRHLSVTEEDTLVWGAGSRFFKSP